MWCEKSGPSCMELQYLLEIIHLSDTKPWIQRGEAVIFLTSGGTIDLVSLSTT